MQFVFWFVAIAASIALLDTVFFALRTTDWRVFAAALLAGLVGALGGLVAVLSSETVPLLTPLLAAGLLLAATVLWWRVHPRSWGNAWDGVVDGVGHFQMMVTYVIIVTVLVVVIVWCLRACSGV